MIKKIIHKFLNIHPDAMSFQNSMDLAELPVVTFRQGDKKINFLLDTGSNNCIIDSTSLKSLKHQPLDITNKVSGIEGIESEGKVCILKLNYKDKEYNFPYIVKDMKPIFDSIKKETGVTVNGMLGSKFFNEFKYVLDFDELIAYSKE
jgi:hypothetical protein